jgi:signal transduction histidine kinase
MQSGHPPQSASHRIIGTGEMADRVRAYDWSSTSLGPIESWSKELVTIVNLTLCSPSPARTMWGPDYILIYNDGYRPIPGPRHPEALGKSARDIYGEAWHVVGPLLDAAFTRGETCYYEKLAIPLETGNGVQNFYLSYSFNPIYEDGKIAGLFGPLHDMTGQVVAEKERDALTKALLQSEKLAAVGRLASSIAHEINNPLESVMNLIYLARQHAVVPETQQYLDVADQEIRRISIIANQTLRFHKQPSNPQAISCLELYSSVLSIYEGRLRNSNIMVEKRLQTEQPVVCFGGDIRQVLSNLVSNAIDAMPTGGRLLLRNREATHWATGRKGIVLTVADTGGGMDAETFGNIFDAFFTTKGIAGTGLGLWVSQEIVERHNGALKVRTSQRKGCCGTVFALFLPFEAEHR